MGCPAKKVIGGYSGSALMREPDHALRLIEATVEGGRRCPSPSRCGSAGTTTASMRRTSPRVQRSAGVQMITVHGRTRMQFYEGEADWDAIRAVRERITGTVDRQWRRRHAPRMPRKSCAARVPMR